MSGLIDKLLSFHRFLSRNLFYPITLSTFLVFSFFAARIYLSRELLFGGLIWNLFLAWLPYLFSLVMVIAHRLRPRWWWAQLIPGALWLLFLPNAFYIMTDFIHLAQRQSIPMDCCRTSVRSRPARRRYCRRRGRRSSS